MFRPRKLCDRSLVFGQVELIRSINLSPAWKCCFLLTKLLMVLRPCVGVGLVRTATVRYGTDPSCSIGPSCICLTYHWRKLQSFDVSLAQVAIVRWIIGPSCKCFIYHWPKLKSFHVSLAHVAIIRCIIGSSRNCSM